MEAIETARLRLRALAPGDLDRLAEVWLDPAVARLLISRPRSRAEVEERMAAMAEQARLFGLWAIEEKAGGLLLGRCGFYAYTGGGRIGREAEPELAFLLARSHWGRGLATEAGRACLDFLFRCHPVPRAVALVRPEHAAAQRVLEKLGMARIRAVAVAETEVILYAVARATGGG